MPQSLASLRAEHRLALSFWKFVIGVDHSGRHYLSVYRMGNRSSVTVSRSCRRGGMIEFAAALWAMLDKLQIAGGWVNQ